MRLLTKLLRLRFGHSSNFIELWKYASYTITTIIVGWILRAIQQLKGYHNVILLNQIFTVEDGESIKSISRARWRKARSGCVLKGIVAWRWACLHRTFGRKSFISGLATAGHYEIRQGTRLTQTRRPTSHWTWGRNSDFVIKLVFLTRSCVNLVSPHVNSIVGCLVLAINARFWERLEKFVRRFASRLRLALDRQVWRLLLHQTFQPRTNDVAVCRFPPTLRSRRFCRVELRWCRSCCSTAFF